MLSPAGRVGYGSQTQTNESPEYPGRFRSLSDFGDCGGYSGVLDRWLKGFGGGVGAITTPRSVTSLHSC